MLPESPRWGVDLHTHVSDLNPVGDAKENNPSATGRAMRRLLREQVVNAVSYLCHDGFPTESVENTSQSLDPQILVGNEVSAHILDNMRVGIRKMLIPMVHLVGIFQQRPEWPFPALEWPKKLRERLAFVKDALPSLEEVFAAIRDHDGIVVIAHPSPVGLPRPWGSLTLSETANLKEKGQLDDAAIELNGHWLYRSTNKKVARFAITHGMAVVGGSDAHKPEDIGKQSTIFPRKTGHAFTDLKRAIDERKTRVKRGKRFTLFNYDPHALQS